jgi:hypothetical protein
MVGRSDSGFAKKDFVFYFFESQGKPMLKIIVIFLPFLTRDHR